MSLNFARPLNSVDLAFDFLTRALQLDEVVAADATQYVMKAEKLLENMSLEPTLTSAVNRHPLHKSSDKRVLLRKAIFDDLVNKIRLIDDEGIVLGVGGAKPNSEPLSNKQAILLTGLPASGKSTIASKLADLYGAFVVDSDFAKRKFPEFGHEYGASLVHEESSIVTFGSSDALYSNELSLQEFCVTKGINMVIPKIGNDLKSLRQHRDALLDKGYKVHLVLVSLDKQESCRRALNRFLATKRYVPLGLVFDGYANDPILTYYRIRDDVSWVSVGKVSTLELQEKGVQIVHSIGDSPIKSLVKSEL